MIGQYVDQILQWIQHTMATAKPDLHFQALHLARLLVSFLLETTMFVFPPSAFSIGLLVISSLVMTLKCILKIIKIIK